MTTILVPAVIGLAVGIVVGALGAGGGILTVPILVYVLDVQPYVATSSSLVIVGLSALVSMLPHAHSGNVSWGYGGVFGLLGIVGAFAGTWLATFVLPELLMVLLAVLLVVVAALMLRKAMMQRRPKLSDVTTSDGSSNADTGANERSQQIARIALTLLAASGTGLLTGFFGVGGGFAVVPALVLVLGIDMRRAVGTSLLVILINAVVSMLARLDGGVMIDWPLVLSFAVASMVGGLLGARLSGLARPATLTLAFGLLLTFVALGTAIQAVPALVAVR